MQSTQTVDRPRFTLASLVRDQKKTPSRPPSLTVPRPIPVLDEELVEKFFLKPWEAKALSTGKAPNVSVTKDLKLLQGDKELGLTKIRELGSGTYGRVYQANSKKFGPVAIKLVHVPIFDLDETLREWYILSGIARAYPEYLTPSHLIKVVPLEKPRSSRSDSQKPDKSAFMRRLI
jgi:hypothetical protein